MSAFKLSIELGNDAMQTSQDIANALNGVAARLKDVGTSPMHGVIRDINGNRVGEWEVDNEGSTCGIDY